MHHLGVLVDSVLPCAGPRSNLRQRLGGCNFPTATLARFAFHSDYRTRVFTADFDPEELGLTPVYCRNIPGTSVGHVSEIMVDDNDMNDAPLTETESTRTSSMSPARRF